MNSFKKIALGMVAAMTLGTIVATPASANTLAVSVSTSTGGNGTAAAPYTIKVPFDNVVSDTTTVGGQEALTLGLSNLALNVPVTITATGNVRLVTALGAGVTSTSGSTSLTFTPLAATATFYAFTTSTTASAITVSVLGASQTIYLRGEAGPAYFIKGAIPANGHVGSKVTATLDVTDIFGNAVTAAITGTGLNATLGAAVVDPVLLTGKYTVDITLPSTVGTAAVNFAIPNPADVPSLAVKTTSITAVINSVDLNAILAAEKAARAADAAASAKALADAKAASDAEILALKADIVVLKADAVTAKVANDMALADAKAAADKALADAKAAHAAELAKVTADNAAAMAAMKKAFNSLAKKWNKKNPKAKVALVK